MHIPLTEPAAPRYIYINPANNLVHLFVPLVQGQEISTDNTCKSTASLDDFFKQGSALRELNNYKSALEFDLQLLASGHPLREPKLQRLTQINDYIQALTAMNGSYTAAITTLMQATSNLYSIQLRPRAQDASSRVLNPVFSIERDNDTFGTPLSALYNAMVAAYPDAAIADPQAKLTDAVLALLPEQPVDFETIQRVLNEQCQHLFGLDVDFTKKTDSTAVSKASIDALMGFSATATREDYIEALLGNCAPNLWQSIPTPPFYNVRDEEDKSEKLSILTQFFLANVNIYCKANGISNNNFGAVLDASANLSNEVAGIVASALGAGADVEECLCQYFNKHIGEFGLSRALTPEDITAIKQKFERTYKTVTATKENPHMDDFMILEAAQTGKFVTHQGSICTDFSELVAPLPAQDNACFQTIRADFRAQHESAIPPKNEHIQASIEIDMKALLSKIKDDNQFEKLPKEIKHECLKSPEFQLRTTFLHHGARGKQDEAEALLQNNPDAQQLLLNTGTFTDYSGRTFNCSAYEYAYWAKDTHMRRMLERYMSDDTKAQMHERCLQIEAKGLRYEQRGQVIEGSKHFDFTPLKQSLNEYIQGFDNWYAAQNWPAMEAAWMKVGRAQRDVSAHVAQEYCRPDRSFDPCPQFNEAALPRSLKFYNWLTGAESFWFPLSISDSAGLSVDFTLLRGGAAGGAVDMAGVRVHVNAGVRLDFSALGRLDEVRTDDLRQSLDDLQRRTRPRPH